MSAARTSRSTPTCAPAKSHPRTGRLHLGRLATLALAGLALTLAVGCGDDPSFCVSACESGVPCGLDDVDGCIAACEEREAIADELGGSACVAATHDYIDCALDEFCGDIESGASDCDPMDAIQGEIDACGESLGEF
jgi:hypothetical protein